MDELIASIARKIVSNPDDVEVTCQADDDVERYELSVAQEDLGKVIGRKGRTARAFRTLLEAASAKSGRRLELEIVE
jgi:predicted RNA-binding protein YlqC (UPF0109 family)